MKIFLTVVGLYCFAAASSQHTFKMLVRSGDQVLPGATLFWRETGRSFITDSSGLLEIREIPAGRQHFRISHVGYKDHSVNYIFPLEPDAIITVDLEPEEVDEEEVVVTATRTSRTIANTATRTEVISGEELDEKANMKPGDIRMLLNETTGIQTQQTSATSYNSSIRIQGLDGRYTQILKDGFPLFAGFSGGLSLMQVAPLDLQQVEVIKGSSSTLYGGGAIAGLVNLVSKVPHDERELRFLVNATSAGGLDLSDFYSQRFKKTGLTVFASRNSSAPYDPAGISLTAIPKFERYSFHPRLFLYGKKTEASIGLTYTVENRIGGSIDYIKNGVQGYFEKNKTDRIVGQVSVLRRVDEYSFLTVKSSYSHFNRSITVPAYMFSGLQQSFFSELSYNRQKEKMQWVAGLNVLTDDFSEDQNATDLPRDYHYTTIGLFLQNTWAPPGRFTLESGLRGDRVAGFGFELLPRLSALFRVTPGLTIRAGGGMGYKTPTVFNEEAERMQFQQIRPIGAAGTRNERSTGVNMDINYRTTLGAVSFSVNHLFFYTRLNDPLVLVADGSGGLIFQNAPGHIDTRGMETNLKFIRSPFKLFIGYTYADVNTHYNQVIAWLPLTARHRLNNVLFYEKDESLKLGLEAYYTSPQKLSDGTTSRSYWVMGFMIEKLWEKVSVFINFENFTDTRQTRYGPIFTGPVTDPVFRDIYAPVDGFVINGGVKLKL